jgi:hypothetical protein
MNQNTTLKCNTIISAYPELFRDIDYISCENGWYELISKLSLVLEHHIKSLPEELAVHLYAVQVKQKFGHLRFYMNATTPFIEGAIALAEEMSGCICEWCGQPGSLPKSQPKNGWILALCDDHRKEYDDRLERAKK